jgi:regulator of sigma E protease
LDPSVNSDPAADPVDNTTQPPAVWLRQNAVNLVIGVGVAVLVLRYLNPLDVLLAAFGLTAIIFIHELGHFLAAKLCRVRVDTFSIGFGPAIPGCHFKYGETTYKLAVVPLGGFVKMLGQEDGVVDGEPDDDPRSYKNQSVPERMLIISAGVVMNVLLGGALFVAVYLHGLDERPAEIAYLEPGGAAWRYGLHSGTRIEKLGGRVNPWFDDIRPIVWATQQGEKLPIAIEYKGVKSNVAVEPLLEEGAAFPLLGINPPDSLTLAKGKRDEAPPFRPGSPAEKATGPDGGFRPGDTIVAMTDPDAPGRAVTPVADVYAYFRRLSRLAGEPVVVHVRRADAAADAAPVPVTVPPAFRREVGLRMRMGQVVAVRAGSDAEKVLRPKAGGAAGDRIVEVEIQDGSRAVVFAAGDKPGTRPLDPMRLPGELNRWADRTPGPKTVKVTVLRDGEHAERRETVTLAWDDESRFDLTAGVGGSNTPVPVNGLGLAYQVQAVADAVQPGTPAAAAGLQPNDAVEAVRLTLRTHTGPETVGPWEEIKPHQWAAVDAWLQRPDVLAVEVRASRAGQKLDPVKLAPTDDPAAPADERGIDLSPRLEVQRAADIGDALGMGFRRTLRSINGIYLNLYAMVFGRMSAVQTLSGPITLARASYMLAGESVWRLLLLLALISINLAVVNFLPIPVLDGGHMVFLAYEGLRRKPAPERVQVWLTVAGLVCVGCLMLFVVGLDVYRLAMMWIARW